MNNRASKKCLFVETMSIGLQYNSTDFPISYQFKRFFWIDLKYINVIFWRKHFKKKQIKIKHNFGAPASKMDTIWNKIELK